MDDFPKLEPITVRPRELKHFPLMERLGELLRKDSELHADWPPRGYDSWRNWTPAEYEAPKPEREGPDPDAERDRLLDDYERNRQEEAEGPEGAEP